MRAGGLDPATPGRAAGLIPGNGRSMRAGGLDPATRNRHHNQARSHHSFNEGRGVRPGNTPKV